MNDTKAYIVTYIEEIKGRRMRFVSHAIGNNTLENYILPQEPLSDFPCKQDAERYYIDVD